MEECSDWGSKLMELLVVEGVLSIVNVISCGGSCVLLWGKC